MTTILSAVRVDGPAPVARPYGLLQSPAVPLIDETDQHWLNGIAMARYPLAVPSRLGNPCIVSTPPSLDADRLPGSGSNYAAFGVEMGVQCDTRGFDFEEERRRLQAAFVASEGAAVEAEFQYASEATNASLAGCAAAANHTLTGTVGIGQGIGLLEQAFADHHGSLGVLHISPKLAAVASARAGGEFLIPSARNVVTINGTPVVIGAGYTGHQPSSGGSANDSTHEYAYISGPINIRRTEVTMLPDEPYEAIDRETNTITVYALRYYTIAFDCDAVYAQRIDLTTL